MRSFKIFFALVHLIIIGCYPLTAYSDASGKNVVILFPDFPVELDLFDAEEPAPIIIMQLLTQPLVRGSTDTTKGFVHVLTDALVRSFDNRKLSLRLRRDVAFSSGEVIRLLDVSYSISRCSQFLPELKGAHISGKSTVFSESYSEIWINIELPPDLKYQDFINSLGKCPILEYKNSVIFGARLGLGSNLIGAGEYFIYNFKPGKSYLLSRSSTFPDRRGAETVEIATYKDSGHGLRMLQSGNADAIIQKDEAVNSLAAADSTLEVIKCFNRWLVRRKGFRFNCTNDFTINGVGYVS